jgi:hypothetical protein
MGALLAGALSIGGFVFNPISAESAILQNWLCNGAGTLVATTSNTSTVVNFRFTGTARCAAGDQRGPYISTFTGTGSANAVGGCDSGLPLLVTALNLTVRMDAQSLSFPAFSRTERMRWAIPISTYPNVTPFLVLQNADGTGPGNGLRGAGNFISAGQACSGAQRSSAVLFDADWIDKLDGILR